MKRDSIFYKLFQQSPSLLFQLLKTPPPNAEAYRFDCVVVKEAKFEIDGVFLPPETGKRGTVFFCEVQFQKDEMLYERLFAETHIYFYRNRDKFKDWQAVVIYPSKSLEQKNLYGHRSLLRGGQVYRIYLNKLGNIRDLPIWVALMVLTTLTQKKAPAEARYLIERSRQEPTEVSGAIIEMVGSIMAHKFERLSRKDIDNMIGITLKGTRVYEEAREEEATNLILRMSEKTAWARTIAYRCARE